ncbi:flagellar hook-associated protein FlgK [Deferribacter thermophilus]|uniref:flagellar hook-associated protein FlgK n=1 Tax=Deferribacter thermophilus TaxID=53573 RepID=UPI003C28BD2F
MANIFGIFQTGVSGLMVSQAGIDVTGHNIANVNTEGYSRQRISIETEIPLLVHPGPFGRGAKVSSVMRTYDDVLAKNLRESTSGLKYYESLQQALENVEIYFNELEAGSGLGDALKDYFNAWSDLANTAPDNSDEATVKRVALIEKSKTLVQKIHEGYQSIEALRDRADENIKEYINEINDIAKNIAYYNFQIAKTESGGDHANDMRDKRELLLNKLAELVNIKTFERKDGQMSVFVGGIAIVDGSTPNNLYVVENDENDGHYDIYWGASLIDKAQVNITDKISSGRIYAELKSRDEILKGYLNSLDEFAKNLILKTNQLHSLGQGLKRFSQITSTNSVENPSYKFSEDPGKLPYDVSKGVFRITVYNSEGLKVNDFDIEVDPSKDSLNSVIEKISQADGNPAGGRIQAFLSEGGKLKIQVEDGYTFSFSEDNSNILAALGLYGYFKGVDAKSIELNDIVKNDNSFIATSKTGEPGDNQVALEISNLKYEKAFDSKGITFDQFYTVFVSQIASDKREVDTYLDAKREAVNQLTLKLDEVKGVSLDEEFTNLIKFQKAYEANARFITAVDEMLDRLINGTGTVGR